MSRKRFYFEIAKTVFIVTSIPLWFIKMIKYVSTIPNVDGSGNVEQNHYFSIYQNLRDGGLVYLFYLTLIITISLIILTELSFLKKPNKMIKLTGNIIFILFIILYAISLIKGISVGRKF